LSINRHYINNQEHLKPKTSTLFNAALKRCSTRARPGTEITADVRTTFVPVDATAACVLMCNYTGKEVV